MNAQVVLENVGVRYTSRVLFESVNWTIYEGMRVALAGRNGSGKSTLLRIIAGQYEPVQGKRNVVGSRRLRVGFLDQTVLDSAVLAALGSKDKRASVLSYLKGLRSHQEEELEDAQLEWETARVLSGLGFSKALMSDPMGSLSGGWLLRVFIGSALLENPDLLLLDEPTNHLDLSSIQWLEQFLIKEYQGTLILITHDVALQRRTTESLAILHGGYFFYRTHQHDYLTFKESLGEEKRVLEKQIEGVKKKIEENMDFVERFRAKAQTAARAQSKLKMAETLEDELTDLLDRLQRVEGIAYDLHFRFRRGNAGSKFPLSLRDLGFQYTATSPWVLRKISTDIKRGQKVAIIGDNGVGKTTLLNVLAGRLQPKEGDLLIGSGVEMGYFGQHQLDELLLEESIVENLRSHAKGVSLEQMRGWLGAFGFYGNEAASKKAKVLSGGERARLALLRILVSPVNVCLLDEPTNHLDIETKDLLRKAMKDFEGTVLFVSHDRDFIQAIAERILYISLDHQVTDHVGGLVSFFEKYPALIRGLEGKLKRGEPNKPKTEALTPPSLSYEERKRQRNLIKSLEKKILLAVDSIDRLGEFKEQLQSQCEADSFYSERTEDERQLVFKQLTEVEKELHAKMIEWEKWSLEVETLKKGLGSEP